MSIDTVEENRIEERPAALATAEERRTRRDDFFDALSLSSIKRVFSWPVMRPQ